MGGSQDGVGDWVGGESLSQEKSGDGLVSDDGDSDTGVGESLGLGEDGVVVALLVVIAVGDEVQDDVVGGDKGLLVEGGDHFQGRVASDELSVLGESVVEGLVVLVALVGKLSSVGLQDVSGVVGGGEGGSDGLGQRGDGLLFSEGLYHGLVAGGVLVDSLDSLGDEVLLDEEGGDSRVLSEVVPGLHGLEVGDSGASDAHEQGTNQN